MAFLARTSKRIISSTADNGLSCKSPLLFNVLDKMEADKRVEILDTGAANSGTLDTLSERHCKLYITNSSHELSEMDTEKLDSPHKLHRAFVKALQLYKRQKASLDLILLWDLPNYMDKRILASMIEYLSQHSEKQTCLHCYIHTASQMPATPGRYSILKEGVVRVQYNSDAQRPCPAYYQEALHKLMSPFRVQRSILQANGIQEYLLGR